MGFVQEGLSASSASTLSLQIVEACRAEPCLTISCSILFCCSAERARCLLPFLLSRGAGSNAPSKHQRWERSLIDVLHSPLLALVRSLTLGMIAGAVWALRLQWTDLQGSPEGTRAAWWTWSRLKSGASCLGCEIAKPLLSTWCALLCEMIRFLAK